MLRSQIEPDYCQSVRCHRPDLLASTLNITRLARTAPISFDMPTIRKSVPYLHLLATTVAITQAMGGTVATKRICAGCCTCNA
jgi:hypothetical protein